MYLVKRLLWSGIGLVLVIGMATIAGAQSVHVQEDSASSLQATVLQATVPAFDFVGSVGGSIETLTFDGNYLYAGQGGALAVFNTDVAGAPVGRLALPDFVQDVVLDGSLVYAATGDGGLQIVDVGSPTAPRLVGTFRVREARTTAVSVAGNRAFVTAAGPKGGLHVLDVANPATPLLRSSVITDTVGSAAAVDVSGDVVYVAAGFEGGLQIVRVDGNGETTLAGAVGDPDFAMDVQVVDEVAYVAASHEGLYVLDVGNVQNPGVVQGLEVSGEVLAVDASEQVLYVAAGSGGMQMFSTAAPTNPVPVASYTAPEMVAEVTAGVTGTVYLAAGSDGVHAVDVSVPTSPTMQMQLETLAEVEDVQVSAGMAYVAAGGQGLSVVDVNTPTAPAVVGRLELEGTASAVALDTAQRRAYVAADRGGLHVVDVSNPLSVTLQGSLDTPGVAKDMQQVGNMLYLADGDSGVQMIDVSNPLSPTLAGGFDTPGSALALDMDGTLAYVADQSALHVLRVTDATSPTLVGSLDMEYAQDVVVQGSRAYVVDSAAGPEGGLLVVDVSDPANPTLAGSINLTEPVAVSVVGQQAYVALRKGGVVLVDVSNPAAPVLRAQYKTPGSAHNVLVQGTMVYVADYNGGVQILQVVERELAELYLPLVLR